MSLEIPDHRDVRLFKGLDKLSPWGNPTRYLQNARRLKDKKHIGELDKLNAIEALQGGEAVPGGSDELMCCPLCKAPLSMHERRLGPFVWGVDSVHYVTAHQIWPEELDWLLGYIQANAA